MKIRTVIFCLSVAVALSACTRHKELDPVKNITESTDPMRFSTQDSDLESSATKASTPLREGFMVSCWKSFGDSDQQTVMGDYQVIYKTSAWYNSSQWGYVGSAGEFYQDQYEKYWDYANFPYRFHAISPAPVSGGSKISGFRLTDSELVIPTSVEFKMQTLSNVGGVLTVQPASTASPKPEPYIVAQVHRDELGKDTDIISGLQINDASDTKNRSVAIPFHHLTSKIRFGIYTTSLGTASALISDVKVVVKSSDFVTSAKGYRSDLSSNNMLQGAFTSTVKSTSTDLVLVDTGSTGLTGNDMADCKSKTTAFWCGTKDGLLQIPQENVQMYISFKVGTREFSGTITVDSNSLFTWTENNIYTYYIIVSSLIPLEIEFTATLEPWQDISGALETDIEK